MEIDLLAGGSRTQQLIDGYQTTQAARPQRSRTAGHAGRARRPTAARVAQERALVAGVEEDAQPETEQRQHGLTMAEQVEVLTKDPMVQKIDRLKTKQEWRERGTTKDEAGAEMALHETGGLDYYDYEYDKMKEERKSALVWAEEAALSNTKYFRSSADDDLGPLTSDYQSHQIFSEEALVVPGLQEFLDHGYFKMLAELKKDPYRVLQEPPKDRHKADIKIVAEYFQRFEMLADKEEEFY